MVRPTYIQHWFAVSVLLLLSAFTQQCYAKLQGQPRIDSLLAAANVTNVDTAKARLLLNAGHEYVDMGQFDTSRALFAKALQLSSNSGDRALEMDVLNNIGTSYYYQGKYADALQTWEQALAIAREKNNKDEERIIRLNIANALTDLGNYPMAMQTYLELLKAAEAAGNDKDAALCMCNMAIVFAQQDKKDKAIEYYLQADKLFEKTHQLLSQVRNLCNIATTYTEMGKLDKAEEYFTRALAISEKNGFTGEMATALSGIASVYLKQNKYSDAISYFNRATGISKKADDLDMVGVNLENIGKIYKLLTDYGNEALLGKLFAGNRNRALDEAQKKMDTAIKIFSDAGDMDNLKSAYGEISDVERRQGNFKAALDHFTKYKDLSDTLFNQQRDKKLTESTMQYDFDKKETVRKATQDKKDSIQRNVRNSIAAGLLGTLAFSVAVYRQRNKVKKQKENVEKEKRRSDELLLNILPAEVAEELKVKGASDAKMMDDVTVLFTDFKDFTALSQKMSPKELVAEIHVCFSAFDQVMANRGVEKIKTVGDSYMAAGGLPTPNKTHANDVVNAALDILQFMTDRRQKREAEGKPAFEIRMGIHTGPVIAGIVGVKKFQYDIWGDTVNTASRMETSGEVGRINISGATYDLVKNDFRCEYRGKIEAKGKGEVDMYFVEDIANSAARRMLHGVPIPA